MLLATKKFHLLHIQASMSYHLINELRRSVTPLIIVQIILPQSIIFIVIVSSILWIKIEMHRAQRASLLPGDSGDWLFHFFQLCLQRFFLLFISLEKLSFLVLLIDSSIKLALAFFFVLCWTSDKLKWAKSRSFLSSTRGPKFFHTGNTSGNTLRWWRVCRCRRCLQSSNSSLHTLSTNHLMSFPTDASFSPSCSYPDV